MAEPIIGWITLEEASDILAGLNGCQSWSALDAPTQTMLLNTAFSELRDNPNYTLPQDATQLAANYSDDNQRRLKEAQAIHACDINTGSNGDSLESPGVKRYKIGSFEKEFRDPLKRSTDQAFQSVPLSQRVKDKLLPFVYDFPITGEFVRIPSGLDQRLI